MRISLIVRIFFLVLIVQNFVSCTQEKEDLGLEPLSNYLPLQKGKYITYRLDSTVGNDFGNQLLVHQYQVKHVIDDMITDNLGRPSYRVYRYLNNATGTGDWTPNGSYMITPTDKQVEVIEDNLRFIKLQLPLREGTDWHGNSYLADNPYELMGYGFTSVDYLKNWDYNYAAFEPSFTYSGKTYADACIVEQENEVYNFPVTVPTAPGSKFRGKEVYAKNIGLVYREYMLMEYEANPSGSKPFYTGFGITMWMIDHN